MTIGIELVRPAGLPGSVPYAYAAVTDPGRMAFTAGACPLDADGNVVAAWDVVREAFGEHDAPSTLVGVTVLGRPDQVVEVEAVAVLDSRREPAPPHDGSGENA